MRLRKVLMNLFSVTSNNNHRQSPDSLQFKHVDRVEFSLM